MKKAVVCMKLADSYVIDSIKCVSFDEEYNVISSYSGDICTDEQDEDICTGRLWSVMVDVDEFLSGCSAVYVCDEVYEKRLNSALKLVNGRTYAIEPLTDMLSEYFSHMSFSEMQAEFTEKGFADIDSECESLLELLRCEKHTECDTDAAESDEEAVERFCGIYRLRCRVDFDTAFIYTGISSWYFKLHKEKYKLYHENFYKRKSSKWSDDYHDQKRSFTDIKSAIQYIYRHDRRKYVRSIAAC